MLTGQQKRRTLNEATLGALFLTCLSLFNSTHAASTEPPSQLPNDKTTAIDATENPNPFTTDLVLQPTYNHIETGGRSYTQVNQLIYPYSSTVIPGVHVKELHSWFRFEFPFIYQVSPGLNQFGLQDFTFIDGVVKDTSFGAVGIGADLSIPTATYSAFGTGKWSIGPSAGITFRSIDRLQLGLLVQQYFSFAGDSNRPTQSYMYLEPVVKLYLPNYIFLISDPKMEFNWQSGNSTIPINLGIGTAFTPDVVAYLRAEYVVSNTDGDWNIRLNLNYLNW